MRRYRYLGSSDLLSVAEWPQRQRVLSAADVRQWITVTGQTLSPDRMVTATFVVTEDGFLWIADRHSEHVHCARGQVVQSAGEMMFQLMPNKVEVVAVTNQSTGYCPELESYRPVVSALT
jgi:hypothetical protein